MCCIVAVTPLHINNFKKCSSITFPSAQSEFEHEYHNKNLLRCRQIHQHSGLLLPAPHEWLWYISAISRFASLPLFSPPPPLPPRSITRGTSTPRPTICCRDENFRCPALFCPVLSCLVLSCPVLSCPVLSCPVLSCPVLSRPVPSSPVCPVLSCPVLSRRVLSCPVPSCPVLSCPVLSCPVPSRPVPSRPVLSCPVLSGSSAGGVPIDLSASLAVAGRSRAAAVALGTARRTGLLPNGTSTAVARRQ